jgi:hypothetical protein
MALAGSVVKNDVGPNLSRARPTSFGSTTGMRARSRRATDVTGETDHDSEHDGRRTDRGGCL